MEIGRERSIHSLALVATTRKEIARGRRFFAAHCRALVHTRVVWLPHPCFFMTSSLFPRAFVLLMAGLLAAVAHAGPVDTAIINAMKLGDARNYTWSAEVNDDARSYTIEGKTERAEEFSLVTMPLISSLRRRAIPGGGNSDNVATFVFKGDDRMVLRTVDETWATPEELLEAVTPDDKKAAAARKKAKSKNAGSATPPAFSNLQLSLSRPHDELALIVANGENLKADATSFSGTLAETGAMLLLVHAGQDEITPVRASGKFHVSFSGGRITRYEVELEGVIEVVTNDLRRQIGVRQTTLTTVSAVGTTQVEVPDEARAKLGG